MRASKARIVILEGSWERAHEPPLVLPYFQALAISHPGFSVTHRTIRSADDIAFWIRKIPQGSRSFVYFACHGEDLDLLPVGARSRVSRADLIKALERAKPEAIAFLHFGCCEMVDPDRRKKSLQELSDACEAYLVSGYTDSIDWLRSMVLDLALAAELFGPFANARLRRGPKLQANADRFVRAYEQLARRLGFSGLSYFVGSRRYRLFPARLGERV